MDSVFSSYWHAFRDTSELSASIIPFRSQKYIDRRFVLLRFSKSCLQPPLLPGFYPHYQGATLGPVHVGVRSQTAGHRLTAVRTAIVRARRKECEEASRGGGGTKAGCLAASPVGDLSTVFLLRFSIALVDTAGASSFPVNFPRTCRQYLFRISLHQTSRFRPLQGWFTLLQRLAMLLQGRSPFTCDCTLSALITASLTPSVIGDRPSHAIWFQQLRDSGGKSSYVGRLETAHAIATSHTPSWLCPGGCRGRKMPWAWLCPRPWLSRVVTTWR